MTNPGDSSATFCKSCKAPVVWIRTVKGNLMICEPAYVEVIPIMKMAKEHRKDWKRISICTDEGVTLQGVSVAHWFSRFPNTMIPTVEGRIPHWAGCPDADDWRRNAH